MAQNYSLTKEQLKIYEKYSCLALPRHTSYPIAALWTEKFNDKSFETHLKSAGKSKSPLSLYVHVPYCEQLCFYCACNKEILGKERLAKKDLRDDFLISLEKEIKNLCKYVGENPISEIHFGGGTPTFLTIDQLNKLLNLIKNNFNLTENPDFSVEIDPRVTTEEHIKVLAEFGMNRVSLGVQDFDEKVQKAINRLQSFDLVKNCLDDCRKHGIDSVNFDLIYGLPFQSMETMKKTLDQVFLLSPDRIAFYRLAVIPDMFKWQKSFTKIDLLKDEKLLDINMMAINRFKSEGYHFIGLDHFSKVDELLSQSLEDGTLRRNFQGMTTGGEIGVIGIGPSAISQLPHCFAQSPKKTSAWIEKVENGLATERGIELNNEDKIFQDAIGQLYCYGKIDKQSIEKSYNLVFDDIFSDELIRLKNLEAEGIVSNNKNEIVLDPILGRLLVRAVASIFDRHIPKDAYLKGINPNHASRVG